MENKKLTAVEWLVNEITKKHDVSFYVFYEAEILQALEMEKKQYSQIYDDFSLNTPTKNEIHLFNNKGI